MTHPYRWSESEEIHLHLLFDDAKLNINSIAEIMKLSIRTVTQKLIELNKIDDPNTVLKQFITLDEKYKKENNGTCIHPNEILCEIITGLCKRIEVLEKKSLK